MSGNEPTWNDDELNEDAGDLYGAPQESHRPGDETEEVFEPTGAVEPLSLDEGDEEGPSPSISLGEVGEDDGPQAISLDGEEEDAGPPSLGDDDGATAISLGGDDEASPLSLGGEEDASPVSPGEEEAPSPLSLADDDGATALSADEEEASLFSLGDDDDEGSSLSLAGGDEGSSLSLGDDDDASPLSLAGEDRDAPASAETEADAPSLYGDAPAAAEPAGLSLEDDGGPDADAGAPEPTFQAEASAPAAPEGDLANRPAEGARVVSVSEVFSEDFFGAEGASDFLGLDTDFDPTPVEAGAPGGAGSELELSGAPEAALATDEALDEAGMAPPIASPDEEDLLAAAEMEALSDGFDDELGDELDDVELDGELEDELDGAPASGPRPALLVAGAFALGLAAVAAVTFVPSLLGGDEPAEVARGPQGPDPAAGGAATQPADPAGDPGTDADAGPANDTVAAGDPAGATSGEPANGGPRPIEDFLPDELAPDTPADDPQVAVADPADDPSGAADPGAELDPAGAADPVDPAGGTELAGASDPAPSGAGPAGPASPTIQELIAEAADPDSFYARNAGMLDLVWHGDLVPMEAVAANARILTPAVGPVRVHMATADVFEGRLFAVGEDRVWLDLERGRIGLDGRSVDRIERLTEEALDARLDPDLLATGDRVRARVPGGVIYGRVRSRAGTAVTLVTDSGARVTLEDPVLEPVSERGNVALKF